jgi:stearoyl-CoA desaturase (delta-9 desaturase)
MNGFWEKFFFIFTYITQGSSYLSPRAYGIMHRMHHAYTDTEMDPHSPSFDSNILKMMKRTRDIYSAIFYNKYSVEDRFVKNIPEWKWFDWMANSLLSRAIWIAIYVILYVSFAPSLWFLVLVPVHALMGPIHGAVINWYAHKYGEVNFETDNTSRNLFKLDWLMLGEGYHNNHHKFPARSNFAYKKGEFDPSYPIIRLMEKIRIIRFAR